MVRVTNEQARVLLSTLLRFAAAPISEVERAANLATVPNSALDRFIRPEWISRVNDFIRYGDDGSGTQPDATDRMISATAHQLISGIIEQRNANETDTLDLIECLAEIVSVPGIAALTLTHELLNDLRYELLDRQKHAELRHKVQSGAKCAKCKRVLHRGEQMTLVAGGANEAQWVIACGKCVPPMVKICAHKDCTVAIKSGRFCLGHRPTRREEQPVVAPPATLSVNPLASDFPPIWFYEDPSEHR